LRIGIDYTVAVKQRAGIGRITRELVRALAEIDHENEYLLVQARGTEEDKSLPPNFSTLALPLSERMATLIWQRLNLPVPIDLLTGRLDLFHSPDFTLPPALRARTLVTVHDLSFLRVPDCFPDGLLRYLKAAVPRAVRRADHVIADSHNTRRDVMTLLGAPGSKVTVIHCGVEPRFRRMTDAADDRTLTTVRRKYDLPDQFILSVGTIQPRKNFARLVEAFGILDSQFAIRNLHLVIAGGKGWLYDGVLNKVKASGLESRVHLIGFVNDADLPALYNLSRLFAFPSLYEGFGLPPLEAMACGTPVVCSKASSLPEVVGDAALTVDPLDVTELAEAMRRAIEDESLRSSLVQRGLVRAAQFTWSKAAEELLKVYLHVTKGLT